MTNYKQLCAELANELDHNRQCLLDDRRLTHPLADKARAALAEPEPEGPTDEELSDLLYFQFTTSTGHGEREDVIGFARAVLARWGNHPASPDSSAPQPMPVSERWPEFSDCDDAERVWCWSWAIGTWRLSRINQSIHSHWLPAHALPVPSHD